MVKMYIYDPYYDDYVDDDGLPGSFWFLYEFLIIINYS